MLYTERLSLSGIQASNWRSLAYSTDGRMNGLCEGMGEKKQKKGKKKPFQTLPKEVEKALLAGLSASALRMKHAYFLSL